MSTAPTPIAGTFESLDKPTPVEGTLEPLKSPPHGDINHADLAHAMVTSKMTGIHPAAAYENKQSVEDQFKELGIELPNSVSGIAHDIKVGLESSVIGLAVRQKMPEELHNPNAWDELIEGVSSVVGDLPVILGGMLAGGVAGSAVPAVGTVAGGAMGAFAVPAALRKSLILGIEKGDIKDVGDLLNRTADVALEGTKGAAEGLVYQAAGGATIPLKALGPTARPIVEHAMKAAQQAAAITVAGGVLDQQMPTVSSFGKNAALIGALELVSAGLHVGASQANQGLKDLYVKDGTHPTKAVSRLEMQPVSKPDIEHGLRPAIRITNATGAKEDIVGNKGEIHSELAKRMGVEEISMEQLEADHSLAKKVLDQKEIQVQDVINRAYEIAQETEITTDLPPKKDLKSGRGFMTDGGDYLTRSQAKNWVKANEPEVYEMWKLMAGDEKAEFHAVDYDRAVKRLQGRDMVEGETNYSALSLDNIRRIQAFRKDLNDARLAESSSKYGAALRSFFVGQRDMRVDIANNLRLAVRKALPDLTDRQALTFMRDYKGNEAELQAKLNDPAIREKFQDAVPAMEKALNPTPELRAMDSELTKYAVATFEEARGLGIFDSTIPPDKYITHILARSEEGEAKGLSRPKMTKRTPFGFVGWT